MKYTHSIGLDIQRTYVSAVRIDLRTNAATHAATMSLAAAAPGGYWDAVSKAVKKMQKQMSFKGKNAICALPLDNAVVKIIEAPGSAAKAQTMLTWELETNLFGPINEYFCDFYEVDKLLHKYAAVAARKEAVAAVCKVVRNVNLEPRIIDLDLFALARAFHFNYKDKHDTPAALVHGEGGCTKIVLVQGATYIDHIVRDIDTTEIGGGDYAAMLAGEIDKLVSRNDGVSKEGMGIFLAGSLFTEGKSIGEIDGAMIFDPFRILNAPTLDNTLLNTYGPQLAAAVGLSLRGSEEV